MDRRLRSVRLAEDQWLAARDAGSGQGQRVDVDGSVNALRDSVRTSAKRHLSSFVSVLDEGLHFLIHLERLLLAHSYGPSRFAFCTLVSRMKCLTLSFRELILVGQADAGKLIARALLETSELATVAMADASFAEEYAPSDPDADDKEFWRRRVGYGKIYVALRDTYIDAGISEKFADHAVNWRRTWKDDLSGAVHSASWSAFQCALVPSLDEPGSGQVGALGHLSAHTPALCRVVIDEIWLFSEVYLNLLHRKEVPDNLRGIPEGAELDSSLVAADAFKRLFHALADEILADKDELFPDVEEEPMGQNEDAQQGAAADVAKPRG